MNGKANFKTGLVISVFLLAVGWNTVAGQTIYVDGDATGGNDGTSWADAYNYLQDALAAASNGDEIWVAEGVYKPDEDIAHPTGTSDRTATFQLKNGVTMKGGYAGFGEPDPNARDVEAYETILSGDLNGDDIEVADPCDLLDEPTRAENTYHVLTGSGANATAVLDGFTITAGNASGSHPYNNGGGMYNDGGSPTVLNCTFGGNSANYAGGGMRNTEGSNVTLTSCTFSDNSAGAGGGMANFRASPRLTNCTFRENLARDAGLYVGYAGGMCNWSASPMLTNCAFIQNSAPEHAGGIFNSGTNSRPVLTNCIFGDNSARWGGGMWNQNDSRPALIDCTFSGNWADNGGGMTNYKSTPELTNCTFRGNSASGAGGAIRNQKGSSPILSNCTFSENVAEYGGAMSNWNSSEPNLSNCTFSGNSAEAYGGGLSNWSTGRPTLINCLFIGNSAQYGGAGIFCWNSNPSLTNCTFSVNSGGWAGGAMSNWENSSPTLTNCILWDDTPVEIYINQSTPAITYSDVQGGWVGEGNIDADPLFGDPANEDYHLKSKRGRWDPTAYAWSGGWVIDEVHSPCIDAGDPNQPVGNEPAPNGNQINMGAFGGTEVASMSETLFISRGELVVTTVTVDGSAWVGQPVHLMWVVENNDPLNTVAPGFLDGIYLSSNEEWDIDDVLLTIVPHDESVDPGQSYQADVNVAVPGVLPGIYYILVRTDLSNCIDESDGEDNNVATSDPIFVDVNELTVGMSVESKFTDTKRISYYKVTVIQGEDLQINLDDLDDAGTNELYVSFEVVPTRSQFDYRYQTNFAADQMVRVPSTRAGIYYVFAYGSSIPGGVPSEFSIQAEYLPLEITSCTPDHSGNSELNIPTLTIHGSKFDPNVTVLLRLNGQTDIIGMDVSWLDTSCISAQFDLREAAAGTWDLVVINPDTETTSFPFTVVEGGEPKLETRLILPSALGYHRRARLWIEYANTGNAPMAAPLLKLRASEDALLTADNSLDGPGFWTDEPPEGITDTVQVLALGSGADPGVLNIGDSGRIPIYYRGCTLPWDYSYPPIEFDLGVLTTDNNTPIDWVEVEAQVRPYDIAPDLWEAIWPQLKSQIGSEKWGDYLQVLINNAKYLANNGRRTHNVRELFSLEVTRVVGAFIPPRTLASAVDAYCPAPGLALVFARSAVDTIDQWFHVGPLGRGWSHNFEYSLERPDDFTAIVKGPGCTTRTFTRYPGGAWRAVPGDYGVLEDMANGTYQLREKDGLTWIFDSSGRLVCIKEPNANRVTLTYIGNKLTTISHSNGQSFILEYNVDGRIESLTDHAGRQTQYVYDSTGEHLVSVIAPGNRTTAYEYNPATGGPADHALITITFPDGTHIYYAYDTLGRIIEQSRDGGAERIEFSYEGFETVIVHDATGVETTLHYGLPEQLLSATNQLGDSISFRYGQDFSFAGIIGPDGGSNQSTYDGEGNLISLKDPIGHTVSMGYTTEHNRLAWLIDQNGNRISFTTDERGNLTRITYSDSTTETFEYDDAGNVVRYTNRRGQTITYMYNDFGQLTTKDYPDTPGIIDYQYTYGTVGNLTSITDARGTITITYDPNADWMTRIDYPSGYFFEFEYDGGGLRTKRTDQDGNIFNYIYDTIGRLDQMTNGSDTLIVDYDYDVSGRLIQKTLGNGVYTTYEYDAAGQLMNLVNYKSDDTVVSRFDYTYNENGNRTSMTTLDGTYSYGYDLLGQLTSVTYPDGRVVAYHYDAAGNRIEVIDNSTVTAYTPNNMNQYTKVGGVSYTYDADGNMTSKTEDGVTTTYNYNIENRLIGIVTLTDTWFYTYDAFGNRIASTHNGFTTYYLIDPISFGNVAAEYDDTGTLIARYDHGYGLLSRTDAAGVPAYYTFDAIGSTSEVTEPTGNIINSYIYDPFGISLGKSEAIPNLFEFVGEYGVMNDENGISFMRHRFYSRNIGRFLAADPLRLLSGDTNLYRYAYNDPISWIDPSGLGRFERIKAGSSGVGGTLAGVGEHLGKVGKFGKVANKAFSMLGAFVGAHEVSQGISQGDWKTILHGSGSWGLATVGIFAFSVSNPVGWTAVAAGAIAVAHDIWTDWRIEQIKKEMGDKTSLPDLPADPVDTGSTGSVGTLDPNKKIGPKGFGSGGFIAADPSDQPLVYTIYFENEPNATAAVIKIRVVDQLDTDLDWSTFELIEIGFGPHQVIIPPSMTHYQDRLEIDGWTWNAEQDWHTGETPLVVDIDADIDIASGQGTWHITASDPETGWEPEDARAGFLPPDDPNDITHRGEGYLTFLIRPKTNLPTGTQITNSASIFFDANPAIDTNEVLNTIDSGKPSSSVLPLSDTQNTLTFTVSWDGNDDPCGSGIKEYEIYVSDNDGPYTHWITTSENSAIFTGQQHHQYSFYSRAHDNVGYYEDAPEEPDAVTTVLVNQPPTADAGPDQTVERESDEGTEVMLDGSGSTDPDSAPGTNDDIVSFDWYEGDAFLGSGEITKYTFAIGTHTVRLVVTDSFGETDDDEAIIIVQDTTPPEIEITVPQTNAALQDGVTLTAEASDVSGVTELYFYLREPGDTNGVPIGFEDLPATLNAVSGQWEYAFDTTQVLDGYYVILAKGIDTYGNVGWSEIVPFSIRNWAVIELLPASESNKAGRTMPVKFSLRIAESVDPAMPFVYNEGLEIRIYDAVEPSSILQKSVYGEGSTNYRIDSLEELYITNFKTKREPAQYVVQIWRISKNFLVGSFTFEIVK